MKIVFLTALGVGGATAVGALIGFIMKGSVSKHSEKIIAFAAGIMLSASFFGLLLPALGSGTLLEGIEVSFCVALGAVAIPILGRGISSLAGRKREENGIAESSDFILGTDAQSNKAGERAMLFVLAMAIHNLPEGIAAGVGFAGDNIAGALTVAGGIALQNIPEGMVIIPPMLAAGIKPWRSFLYAALTGLSEIIGVVLGYYFAAIAEGILPIALSLAAGAMIYVSAEGISGSDGKGDCAVRAIITSIGFAVMTLLNFLIAAV